MSDQRIFNVLFLCQGNSARSIMAEAILAKIGMGKFRAFSAGSQPHGTVNPMALSLLQRSNHETAPLRSKSWDEFIGPDAPKFDFVITLCDDAAQEACPVWPGTPMRTHWPVPDPANATGDETHKALAFADAFRMLERRISILAAMPVRELDKVTLQAKMDTIGKDKTLQD